MTTFQCVGIRQKDLAIVQVSKEKAIDALASIPKDGNITGTNNDLRRLTMQESKAVLLKLGLSEEEIKGELCPSWKYPSTSGLTGSRGLVQMCRCICFTAWLSFVLLFQWFLTN